MGSSEKNAKAMKIDMVFLTKTVPKSSKAYLNYWQTAIPSI